MGELSVSAAESAFTADGAVAGRATYIVVTFRETDPSVPGIALRAGGTVSVQLPDSFVDTGTVPVASVGSSPDCSPPLLSGCSAALLLQGWPQSPVLPFAQTSWDAATNSIVITASADWTPAGVDAPGPKQALLMLRGFRNPMRPGAYPIGVEIRPDPSTTELLSGVGAIHIDPHVRPTIAPSSLANGGPPPPFPNTLFQSVEAGDTSLNMASYLWDRDGNAVVGADFGAGDARLRLLHDARGRPIGLVRVQPPAGAQNWSLVSLGPSTPTNAFVSGVPTGQLIATLDTDPAVTGTYLVTFALFGADPVIHRISAG